MHLQELIVGQLQMSANSMQSVLTDDITDEEARARPEGLAPIVWQAGHIAYYEALLVAEVQGGRPDVPEIYEGLFKQGSEGDGDFPPLADVVDTLKRSQSGLLRLAEGDLAEPLDGAPLYSSLGGALLFSHYHRGYHMGKIMTLRGLLNKPILF